MDDVVAEVSSKKPGDEVSLKLIHKSQSRTVKVELGKRPESVDTSAGSGQQSEPQSPDLIP
jgi:S1-C subfamily serine protease